MEQFIPAKGIKASEVVSPENFVILTKQGKLITEKSNSFIAENFQFPLIRRFDKDLVLIVNRRFSENENNAKIYNLKGNLETSFEVGDAVSNVLVYDRKLVVSYLDEGVMAGKKMAKEGLVIFNKKGKMVWGFNSNNKYQIWDCYHTIKTAPNKALFFGYGQFPMLELNTDFKTIAEVQIPIDPYVDSVSSHENILYWKKSSLLYAYNRCNDKLYKYEKFNTKDRRKLANNYLTQTTNKGLILEKINEQV